MALSRQFLDRLGDAARAALAGMGAAPPPVENKLDAGFDPVTEADRSIEQALRTLIAESFPEDAIRGEEFGWTLEGAARTWSVDPIDGTRAFICGLPSWTTLVGVIDGDDHVAGMIDLPMLGERLVAIDGQTWRNGAACTTSGCVSLAAARMATTDPFLFEGAEFALFERVREATLVARYGLDAMGYARVATGGIDLVIESGLKRYDLDALVAVVRGAGGAIGDWAGGEDWDGGRIIAAASRPLYEETVALLAA